MKENVTLTRIRIDQREKEKKQKLTNVIISLGVRVRFQTGLRG